MKWMTLATYGALALCGGAVIPLQAAINARLAEGVGGPVRAATVSGLVVTMALAVLAGLISFYGRVDPRASSLSALPWWAWTGGLCGAVVLTATTAGAPKLGAATLIALIMTGQVLFSLVLDNFGLLGLPVHPISLQRVIAAVFLLVGAVLMSVRF